MQRLFDYLIAYIRIEFVFLYWQLIHFLTLHFRHIIITFGSLSYTHSGYESTICCIVFLTFRSNDCLLLLNSNIWLFDLWFTRFQLAIPFDCCCLSVAIDADYPNEAKAKAKALID